MFHSEPGEIQAKLKQGEIAVEFVQAQVTIYVPTAIIAKVTRRQIVSLAREVYGRSVMYIISSDIWTWKNSTSFRLPASPRDGPDYCLLLLQKLIYEAYERAKAKPEEEAPAKPTRKRRPEPGATQSESVPEEPAKPVKPKRPYNFQVPRPPKEEAVLLEEEVEYFLPLSLESFFAKFGPNKTELFIPPTCIVEVGKYDIAGLVKKIYGPATLKRFEMPRWEKKDSVMVLVLPPTFPHCGKYTDPRVEKLKIMILAAHNRRKLQ